MKTGRIKFYNSEKGFGFIIPDDGSNDVFVHVSGLRYQNPKEGDPVNFDVKVGKKGPSAEKVELRK